jgi:hypothetical protein
MDPKFINYDNKATIGCDKDCQHCSSGDINKQFSNKVDCKYCSNNKKIIKNNEYIDICSIDKRCATTKKKNNLQYVNLSLLEELLGIMSSQKRATVVFRGKTILDENIMGMNFILLDNRTFNIKKIAKFNTENAYQSINKVPPFINHEIENEDIVIVITRGRPFRLFKPQNIEIQAVTQSMRKLGARAKFMGEHINYILIGSKKKDIYYESISDDTVFFPELDIFNNECFVNPATIYPTKYTFFQEHVEKPERLKRCAMEAIKYGANRFGIVDRRVCVVISEKEYNDRIKPMTKSHDCGYTPQSIHEMVSISNRGSIETYKFNKSGSPKYITEKKFGANVFTKKGFLGKQIVVGTTDEISFLKNLRVIDKKYYISGIKSLIIPDKFVVYLVDEQEGLFTLKGPQEIGDLNDIGIKYLKEFIVKRVESNSVILCDKKVCIVLGPGKHVLPPFLFIPYRHIKLSPTTNKVILFDDINFASVM